MVYSYGYSTATTSTALDGQGGLSEELTADLSPGPRASNRVTTREEAIKEVQPLQLQWFL